MDDDDFAVFRELYIQFDAVRAGLYGLAVRQHRIFRILSAESSVS